MQILWVIILLLEKNLKINGFKSILLVEKIKLESWNFYLFIWGHFVAIEYPMFADFKKKKSTHLSKYSKHVGKSPATVKYAIKTSYGAILNVKLS